MNKTRIYRSDEIKLSLVMGQFEVWENKLFYYHSEFLGWNYIRGLV